MNAIIRRPRNLVTLGVALLASPVLAGVSVEDALREALADERRSRAAYEAVLAEHGDVRPFVNVVRGEERHIAMLEDLFAAREIAVPPDPYLEEGSRPAAPTTIVAACGAAVAAEQENAAIYHRLLPDMTDDDVREVFDHLRMASLEHHLPAFERCVERGGAGGGPPGGRGRGRGQGPGPGCGRWP